MSGRLVRLFVESVALSSGKQVCIGKSQANYLFNVMRLRPKDTVSLFNNTDGEWHCEIVSTGKKDGILVCKTRWSGIHMPPDVWLLFAPLKRSRTNFVVEKAVELGVRRIVPIQTDNTSSERIRQDRLQAHAVEAAEQCGATYVPAVDKLESLDHLLSVWPADRRLLYCDETLCGERATLTSFLPPFSSTIPSASSLAFPTLSSSSPWAVLVGPEGGFSANEKARLRALLLTTPVALGPRILRADTAVVAALTLWQATLGDWAAPRKQ